MKETKEPTCKFKFTYACGIFTLVLIMNKRLCTCALYESPEGSFEIQDSKFEIQYLKFEIRDSKFNI